MDTLTSMSFCFKISNIIGFIEFNHFWNGLILGCHSNWYSSYSFERPSINLAKKIALTKEVASIEVISCYSKCILHKKIWSLKRGGLSIEGSGFPIEGRGLPIEGRGLTKRDYCTKV